MKLTENEMDYIADVHCLKCTDYALEDLKNILSAEIGLIELARLLCCAACLSKILVQVIGDRHPQDVSQ